MSKKRKITAWVIACLLWESVVVGVHIFMRSQFKFPTLNFELLGWLIPVFMTVPFWALFFGIVSVHRKKLMKVLAKTFTAFGIVIYVSYISLIFGLIPGLYPLMSDTKNTEDYLIFDTAFEGFYDEIVELIPETIPENATNVVYNYHYEPESDGWLYIYWELPEDEYEAFKNETLKKDGTITEDSRGIIFNPSWNSDGFLAVWLDLILNDDNNSIICDFSRCFSC